MIKKSKPNKKINYNLNNNIKVKKLLVISVKGEKLGLMSKAESLAYAEDQGLDLLLVSNKPDYSEGVARVVDYGKMMYRKAKKLKQSRKLSHTQNHEIRLRANIEEHDLKVKINKTIAFLKANSRVKVSLRFRGREVTHADFGFTKMEQFLDSVGDVGKLESKITKTGMFLNMIIVPNNNLNKQKQKIKDKD